MKKSNFKQRINACLFFTSLLFSSVVLQAQNYCSSTPVAVHGSLSVSGNKIVDKNNNPVSFAGNSFFWSNTGWGAEKYYNADVVNWLASDWNTTIVRAAMGVEDSGGYLSNPTENKNRVKAVVDAAIAKGIYVIIDWHSHHAEDNEAAAISFFQEMAQTYGNNPHVIYEIYNEPLQVSWSNTIKPYAERVSAAIRAIDPDNLIIVGTSTWSQDVDIASNDPITSTTNIAYTLHFYAATHKESLRQKAQTALNNGVALMVTEWGSVEASGNGSVDTASTDAWMSFLATNNITHANWSLHDKSEGASVLNPGASTTGGWAASNLTASGTKVKSIVKNWKQYCSDTGTGGGTTNQEPSVSITSPAANSSSAAGTTIQVKATATDADGTITQVAFYANGSLIGTDVSSPYTQNWNPTSGSYTLTAIATDNAGAKTTSTAVAVTIGTLPGGGTCTDLPVWNGNSVYANAGTEVVFNGNIYKNNWYTKNQSPATNSGQWEVWTLVSSCTTINATSASTEIKLYPNPSSDKIQIEIGDTEDFSRVSILDFQGRVVYENKITSKGTIEIPLSNYNEGMYFVKLSGKKEVTKSFIKKR
ncbi:cellulase family glycosylhydrolase [Cellulophaga sp. HaHa_2_1]|uniref:cellulase family glycosylhydrolase n=1 Tax=Cellulophaga sp. HaHa_2_1 TaxID=2749994 RepID=UPI001C4F88AE|nr:cellulase family glycosylhydrolase [Cellulophaga sp. HaHa_2_1]QXP53118.1 cellulase family glycosylhydrolase [Cellulophaga sp. HaHa_2_1]